MQDNEDKIISMSPTPSSFKRVNLDFSEVVKEILEGKSVTKLEWQNKEIYGYLKDGKLTLHKPDGKDYVWRLSDGDLAGKDYIVLPELPKAIIN